MYVAMRCWTIQHTGSQNSHYRDDVRHFGLTPDGREVAVSAVEYEQFTGPRIEGGREIPSGHEWGGGFACLLGWHWDTDLERVAAEISLRQAAVTSTPWPGSPGPIRLWSWC